MANNKFSAASPVQDLGPLGGPSGQEIQGKLIWVDPSPLDPGHWELDPTGNLPGVDEPIRQGWGGSGFISGLPDGGGGVIRGNKTTLIPIVPFPPIPSKEDGKPFAWAKCRETASGVARDCCTSKQKKTIQEAFKKLVASSCLSTQYFPTLLADLIYVYKNIVKIKCVSDCDDGSGLQFNARYNSATRELEICNNEISEADIDRLVARMLHELIHAAGGNEIDAVAVIHFCFPGKAYDFLENYIDDIRRYYCAYTDSAGNKILFGKYTMWSPKDGVVFTLQIPGSVDLNGGFAPIIDASHRGSWAPWLKDSQWINRIENLC